MEIHDRKQNNFAGSDWLLPLVLLPLYFAVWGKFGQKFAAAVGLSLITGVGCWFVAVLSLPASQNFRAGDMPFCWSLFLLFPLYYPLGLALWVIPPLLIMTYLIVISSFGGYRRHLFNPLIVAVVLMLVGYGSTASLSASRPFAPEAQGYRIWSAGVPPTHPVWYYYATVPLEQLFSASYSCNLPAMPGSAYTLPLLILAAILAVFFRRGRAWFLTLVMATPGFSTLACWAGIIDWSPLHPLLLGLIPVIALTAVADQHTLPQNFSQQMLSALFFSALAIVFTLWSVNPLAAVYAFLLAQVMSPLLFDLLLPEPGGAK